MNKPIKTKEEEQIVDTPEISETQEGTHKKMQGIMQQMEMMALQRSNRNNLDISTFDKDQKDKLLNLMEKNEDNAFAYSTKRLDVQAKLNLKALDASIIDQKTLHYVLIGGGIALFTIMLLILFFKDQYFIPYLTFITGLGGGMGLKGFFSKLSQKPQLEDEDDD